MAPARNARERAAMERRNAVLRTSTNLATRDLYYRIALVNNDLKSQRADKDTSHAELSKRIEQLEALVGKLAGRLGE
jgi:hypothetical protein